MLWMHYLVGVSHFATVLKIGQRLYEKMYLLKSPMPQWRGKVIWNPYPGPDYRQHLISFPIDIQHYFI